MTIEQIIKHFKGVRDDYVAVLDSGFGVKKGESNTFYRRNKRYTEAAIEALEKQIPKKPTRARQSGFYICPCPDCNKFITKNEQCHGNIDISYCKWCGQKLDWSEENDL